MISKSTWISTTSTSTITMTTTTTATMTTTTTTTIYFLVLLYQSGTKSVRSRRPRRCLIGNLALPIKLEFRHYDWQLGNIPPPSSSNVETPHFDWRVTRKPSLSDENLTYFLRKDWNNFLSYLHLFFVRKSILW